MAKERRTDITNDAGRITTRREAAVTSGTEKNPTVKPPAGRTTAIRSATTRSAPVVSSGRKTTSANSVTNGRSRIKKKFPYELLIGAVVVCVAAVLGWRYYSAESARKAQEAADRQAAIEKDDKEREEKKAAFLAEKQRKKDEALQKKKEAEEKALAEIVARRKAAEEAEAAQKREEALQAQKAKAAAEARKADAARIAKLAQGLKAADEEAKGFCRQGKFDEADKLLGGKLAEAAAVLEKDQMAAAEKTHRAAKLLSELTQETQPGPESSAEKLFIFVMKDGSKARGKIETEIGSELVIIGPGNAKMTLDPEKIASRKKIDQAELDQEILKGLDERRKTATAGVDWLLLGIDAIKGNRSDYGQKAFIKAFETDADIAANIREHRARQLLVSGIFNRSINNQRVSKEKLDRLVKEFGETKAAKMFLGAQDEETSLVAQVTQKGEAESDDAREINAELKKARGDLGANATMNKADTLVAQARGLEDQAQNASNKQLSTEYYKDAAQKLSQALAIYQTLLESGKIDQARFDEKSRVVTLRLYWCRKLQTL